MTSPFRSQFDLHARISLLAGRTFAQTLLIVTCCRARTFNMWEPSDSLEFVCLAAANCSRLHVPYQVLYLTSQIRLLASLSLSRVRLTSHRQQRSAATFVVRSSLQCRAREVLFYLCHCLHCQPCSNTRRGMSVHGLRRIDRVV